MISSPFEHNNPNLEDAATISDITPGVELEVVPLIPLDMADRTISILGDLGVNENGAPVVEAAVTATYPGGEPITTIQEIHPRDFGIAPYSDDPEVWNRFRAARVISRPDDLQQD